MLRVFVGIKTSEKLDQEVERWKKTFREPVRFINKSNLHLTLVPPWYVHESEVDQITKKLIPVQKNTTPFTIKFRQIAYGPTKARPRLIWTTGPNTKNLTKLKKDLMLTLNKRQEKRPFLPHLTLARFRQEDFESFKTKKLKEKIYWKDKVRSFTLFESKLSPKGVKYSPLHNFKL